jgi:NAD-dependent deacetylase
MTPLDRLVQALERTRGQWLLVTGAGVSLASGIPTFRGKDPEAIWARDVTELGTVEYFSRHPAHSWQWYLSRFEKVLTARPNPAHFALAALERWQLARKGHVLLVTQNVDTLHEQAGSRELVKVHGSVDRVRCSGYECRLGAPFGSLPRESVDLSALLANPVDENVPRCPACGELLRQHVLWFDEFYTSHADYQFDRVLGAAQSAQVVLFAGTSFAVGVTELVLREASQRDVPVFSIDPAGLRPHEFVHTITAPAEEALVEVCHRLGAPLDAPGKPD